MTFSYSDPAHSYFEDDVQRKYSEGLALVKSKIGMLTIKREESEYRQVLAELQELITLAREETTDQRILRETLEKIYFRFGSDIKTEQDKEDMIKHRIAHYGELKRYNEERAVIKEIKSARKSGDIQLANKLEDEWRKKYGKLPRKSGRS